MRTPGGSHAHLHRAEQVCALLRITHAEHVERERIERIDGLGHPVLEEEQREGIEPTIEFRARHARGAIGDRSFQSLEGRGELHLADGRLPGCGIDLAGLRCLRTCRPERAQRNAGHRHHHAGAERRGHGAVALIDESAASAASRAVAWSTMGRG